MLGIVAVKGNKAPKGRNWQSIRVSRQSRRDILDIRFSGELGEGSGGTQSGQAREKVCVSLGLYGANDADSCDLSSAISAARVAS